MCTTTCYSVAVDGFTLVVGVQGSAGTEVLGSALVYRYSSADRSFLATEGPPLVPGDGSPDDDFGRAVSVSEDHILVGAQLHSRGARGVNAGAAYVYRRSANPVTGGTEWIQAARLVAPTVAENERFGVSVAIYGGVAIVGANGADGNGENAGAAYVFELVEPASSLSTGRKRRTGGGQWVFTQRLVAPDGETNDNFGFSVAVHGNRAVVGAVWDDEKRGSAYVYTLIKGVWTLEGKFTPEGGMPDDQFGWDVGVYEETVAVGAFKHDAENALDSGAVYVFQRDARGLWNQGVRLTPENGNKHDHFGYNIGLAEDWLVVGAPLDDHAGVDAGAMYIYERVTRGTEKDGTWVLRTKQAPEVTTPDFNEFGFSVAVSKDFFVASSKYSNTAPDDDAYGACYAYGTRRPEDPTAPPTISLAPTRITLAPTETNSMMPSEAPIMASKPPSNVPSELPSLVVSLQPSLGASLEPSLQPSFGSESPSIIPSRHSTSHPSVTPSVQKTGQPTLQPTVKPIVQLTAEPTVQPTAQPITEPIAQPTSTYVPTPFLIESSLQPSRTAMPTSPTLNGSISVKPTLSPASLGPETST